MPKTSLGRIIMRFVAALGVTLYLSAALGSNAPPDLTASKPSPFVQQKGTQFVLDGRELFVTGVNNHYLSWASDAETVRVLDDAVALGANVVRTFLGTAIGDPRSRGSGTIWDFQAPSRDSSDLNVHYLLSFYDNVFNAVMKASPAWRRVGLECPA